jgi:hypothetical protein
MKKLKLSLFLLITAFTYTSAQIGVGIGSHGLNLKTNPDAKTGIIVRTGFGVYADPLQTYIHPEAAWVKRHHYSAKTKLYAGIGANSEVKLGFDYFSVEYGMFVPVGLELFPTDSRKLSVTFETGLNLAPFGFGDKRFENYGLIEITFYLRDDNDY